MEIASATCPLNGPKETGPIMTRMIAPTMKKTMAVAIMGGLLVATVLTLVFLPTLYVAWFGKEGADAPVAAG